ncbi:sensor histidine kinase [Aquabacterium sp. OR-4]|uniref:sensor histidine kinase n=1 Tax=Aquabacterium sp. OR-4 TaxID=2978127 RepID=UPI0021B3D220|nr:ATP-binding protein [Aquabacterium sp. OR-4]MDT7838276.1 ATP-binding protein [Aquabacterium sp. OR-4]
MSAHLPRETQALAAAAAAADVAADVGQGGRNRPLAAGTAAAGPAAAAATAPARNGRGTALSRWVAPAVLLALVVAWAAVGAVLTLKWRHAIAVEQLHSANLARILQEQTVRVLASADQATLRLRDALRSGELAPGDIAHYANETGLAPRILVQLALVGADGRLLASNLDPDGSRSGHVDLSEREHIRVHLAQPAGTAGGSVSAGGLFIGKPVLGKVSGRWTIQLSRRIDGPQGQTLGVVVASLDPAYFEDVYRGVALGAQGGVALVGSDAVVRAQVIGGRSQGMGSRLDAAEMPGAAASAGHVTATRAADPVPRLVSHQAVAGYPLHVAVLRATDEALASWRDTRTLALLLTALLSLAMLGAAAIFHLGLRRLEDSHAALQLSEAAAQSANQAKTDFLAAISHELRTPLTSIRGFAELMEQRLPQPRQRQQAGLIRQAAEYLNTLLTEILDLAKVEAGAMQVVNAPVDLRAVVEGAASFYAITAAEKGLALRVRVADAVPSSLIADELRIKQILNNLLSNAFKFTCSGEVCIEAELAPAAACGGSQPCWLLHVSDTGPGIAAELHGRIFERFRQGHDRVAFEHGGTGLGLALSRALAGLMGGTLAVHSAPGQGARFTLSVPLQA